MLGIFVFGDPFFPPAWSVLVRNVWLGTKKCPGDRNTVPPRKGTSWSAELASLQNPARGTKVREGSDAWNLDKRRI